MKASLLLVIALAMLSGWWGQCGFIHQVTVMIIGIYVWLPVFLVSTLLGLVGWRARRWRSSLTMVWGVLGITVAGLFVSLGAGRLVHGWQHDRVMAFVERAQTELDAERARTGHYPASLPPSLAADLPAWLDHQGSYQVIGDHFQITYRDPSAFVFSDQTYNSSVRQWESLD